MKQFIIMTNLYSVIMIILNYLLQPFFRNEVSILRHFLLLMSNHV